MRLSAALCLPSISRRSDKLQTRRLHDYVSPAAICTKNRHAGTCIRDACFILNSDFTCIR
jgi:hypothetical protein